MEKIPVSELKEGMRVGQTLYNEQGAVLLARGTGLTLTYIAALQSRGFHAIYVQDGVGDDLLPPEILSPEVRSAVREHVGELFVPSSESGPAARKSAISNLAPGDPKVSAIYEDVRKIVQEVMDSDSISGMASVKSHDNYTFEHSVEVTVTAVLLGKHLDLTMRELHQLALGCLCHDVGKVWVPPEILNKPGRLTPDEFEIVRQHPSLGYEAARRFMRSDDIIARSVVWQHHERQDRSGYPQGLAGTNEFKSQAPRPYGGRLIVPAAEIAAVADVYSALASDRPYREALTPSVVASTMREMAGTHLNLQITRFFLSIFPLYPVGTKVTVASGKLAGHVGVVVEQNRGHMERPKVRIVADASGRAVAPVEVDTSKEADIELAAPDASRGRRALVRSATW